MSHWAKRCVRFGVVVCSSSVISNTLSFFLNQRHDALVVVEFNPLEFDEVVEAGDSGGVECRESKEEITNHDVLRVNDAASSGVIHASVARMERG